MRSTDAVFITISTFDPSSAFSNATLFTPSMSDPDAMRCAPGFTNLLAWASAQGGDVAALKSYIQSHSDGKSSASYVAGWRVEITGNASDDYASQRINISYETFFV